MLEILKDQKNKIEDKISYLEKSYDLFLEGHSKQVNGIVISNDQRFIVTSSYDKTIRV